MLRFLLLVGLFALLPQGLRAQDAAPELAGGQVIEALTTDGVTLQADLYADADPEAPAVILLHEYRKDRSTFAPLIPALREAGLTVVNLDLRGHGGSTKKGERVLDAEAVPASMSRALLVESQKDVYAALAALKERGLQNERFSLVGAGYGASAAWVASPFWRTGLHSMVLLSPATGAFAIDVMIYVVDFPGQLLLITDVNDPTSAPASLRILDLHPKHDERIALPKIGRGTHILLSHPEINETIATFVKGAFEIPLPKPEPAFSFKPEEGP